MPADKNSDQKFSVPPGFITLAELGKYIGGGKSFLGLDVGSKTIGVAISDRGNMIASPLSTLRRSKFTDDAQNLRKIIMDRDIAALVIGLPIEMSGKHGKRCQSIRQFARNLAEFVSIPMAFQDERLSTMTVEKAMIAADLRRSRRAEIIDQSAATYILQNALESLRHGPEVNRPVTTPRQPLKAGEKITLAEVNHLSNDDFVAILGGVFEHSPWVAEGVLSRRPFASIQSLHQAMVGVIVSARDEVKMILIRHHPELAGKAALAGTLTAESTREQKGAGLDQCSPAEFADLTALNRVYGEKFSMPFIIAVRGLTRQDIIAAMRQRLGNDAAHEQAEALQQIYRIGQFRLAALIAE